MKTISKLTFATLATLAVALWFQTPLTLAADKGKADEENHGAATIDFTKWVTVLAPRPGIFADMAGVISGGDVGQGSFTGEVLSRVVDAQGVTRVVAVYHVNGSKHSFTVLIHAVQQVAGVGQKGVIVGLVTEGWLKGHTVEGDWLVISPSYPAGTGVGNSFKVTLDIIKSHSNN